MLRAMHQRIILLLRHPVERSLSEFENKRKKPRWIGDARSFSQLVSSTVMPEFRSAQALLACIATKPTSGPKALRSSKGCVAPTIFQSWYDLFLPQWLDGPSEHQKGTLVLFSDDMFANASATLERARRFLWLQPFAFDTGTIYNSHVARGVSSEAYTSGANALRANQTMDPLCVDAEVLSKAQALMADSVDALSPLLKPHGYLVPDAWRRPPRSKSVTACS